MASFDGHNSVWERQRCRKYASGQLDLHLINRALLEQLTATALAWDEREIDLIVAEYLAMLSCELSGEVFNKAAHNRALQVVIRRSHGSIEFKHQNISAVMLGLGRTQLSASKYSCPFLS